MKTYKAIPFVVALLILYGCKREVSTIENLMTFTKVYGYVKYFHPSDEAARIDWNRFSIYGSAQIAKCKSKKQVLNTLNALFKPIAPSIIFSTGMEDCIIDKSNWSPIDSSNCKLTYWQHQGVSFGMEKRGTVYSSIRVHRNEASSLFEYRPDFGESIIEEVGEGIWCMLPITLFCDSQNTFPISDHEKLEKLEERLEKVNNSDPENLYLRLGNAIIVYNVFQHFYPYFDVVEVNWEDDLRKALSQSFVDSTAGEHLITLERFMAPLKDGHITVNYLNSARSIYIPPISWEWIEGKLIITKYEGDFHPINLGDEVTRIDGQDPQNYFDDIYSRISAGTNGWLQFRANVKSLQGEMNTKVSIELNGASTLELERYCNPYRQEVNDINASYREIEDGIFYLNLDMIEMDTVNKLMPELARSKAIICDLRGYPNNNHDFIRHLIYENDTSKSWMQVPQNVYPNHEKVVGYEVWNWMEFMKPIKPYLGDKVIVFIIDGRAISWAESYMGFVEGYKLATIIGQPTAGTNGDTNLFKLPGGYSILWTGMKVLKHDGSQHHGIGILPDIYVEKTIQGVKDGHDEFLEKALELVVLD